MSPTPGVHPSCHKTRKFYPTLGYGDTSLPVIKDIGLTVHCAGPRVFSQSPTCKGGCKPWERTVPNNRVKIPVLWDSPTPVQPLCPCGGTLQQVMPQKPADGQHKHLDPDTKGIRAEFTTPKAGACYGWGISILGFAESSAVALDIDGV